MNLNIAYAVLTTAALSGCLGLFPSDEPRGAEGPDVQVSAPVGALESVPLVNHIQFGVFEMDVFVERDGVPGVHRPTPADAATMAQAPLYATGVATPHDPSFSQGGPFAKGAPLGVTLGEWLAGRGAIAYACADGVARADAVFSRLVPDGVYTLWYARLTMQQGTITGALDAPLGAADGSQNRFAADAQGNGRLSIAFFDCVEPTGIDGSGTGVATVFAAAYHSDGQTYGPVPGDFGSATHVQLFAIAQAVEG